jgi:large subunit ribosomal protein L14e
MLEIGQVCLKTAGREAGKYCVVIDIIDKDFVMITGPKSITKVKRRKCNIAHLEPVPIKIEIAKNATDEEVIKAYEKADVLSKIKASVPTIKPKEPEVKEEAVEKKAEAVEEKPKEEKKKETKKKAKKETEEKPAETKVEEPEKPRRGRKKAKKKTE